MSQFSRTMRRWSLARAGAIVLGAAWLVVLAAFAYAATTSQPDLESTVAAAFALGIALACFLYAWREPGP